MCVCVCVRERERRGRREERERVSMCECGGRNHDEAIIRFPFASLSPSLFSLSFLSFPVSIAYTSSIIIIHREIKEEQKER